MGLLEETKSLIAARFRGGMLDIEDIEELRKYLYELAFDYRKDKMQQLIKAREEGKI